jgi:signal transduction histidine kinase
VGPWRRIVAGPDRPLTLRLPPIFRYAAPLGLLALLGLGVANGAYLLDTRGMSDAGAILLSVGAVLPVAVAVRRPLMGWRLAYPMLFLGPIHALPTESWPWPPVQIIGYLVVVLLVAFTEGPAVTSWITACGVGVPFIFTDRANAYGVAALLVVIALFGDLLSRRLQSNRRLAEQAELTELERARRAVLEERARIAREMHDVVAHHMSMIAVQAETAPFRVSGLSEPARTEFAGIAASARSALVDMRRLLGVLRAETEQPSREPQPGLADLPGLVTAAQRAGVTVTWSLAGDGEVPEPVGLAAYRIVQEALANAARHAPGSPVEAAVLALAERLEILVRNDPPPAGPAAGPPGAGHGLTGMRERAALLGGTLSAGPDPRGGYRVTATLPYAAAPPDPATMPHREDDA